MRIRARFVMLVFAMATTGCNFALREVTVVKPAPPWQGEVDVRVAPATSQGTLLVVLQVGINKTFGRMRSMPDQEQLDRIKAEARQRGANVIVINCGAQGTWGTGECAVQGYKE
jgi:hypothetical protein